MDKRSTIVEQRREKEGAQWKTLEPPRVLTEVDHVFLTGNDDDSDVNFANKSGRMFRISD